MWGAIKSIYPDSDIKDCAFHWDQAVMRRVAKLGRKTAYDNDGALHVFIRKVLALPYLPAAHIRPTFQKLLQETTNSQPLRRLTTYVNRTWMLSNVFAVHQWCVFKHTVRTNNEIAGECISFSLLIYCVKFDIYKS